MPETDKPLLAHLFRRAGFGATFQELRRNEDHHLVLLAGDERAAPGLVLSSWVVRTVVGASTFGSGLGGGCDQRGYCQHVGEFKGPQRPQAGAQQAPWQPACG